MTVDQTLIKSKNNFQNLILPAMIVPAMNMTVKQNNIGSSVDLKKESDRVLRKLSMI